MSKLSLILLLGSLVATTTGAVASSNTDFNISIKALDCTLDSTYDGLRPLLLVKPENCLPSPTPIPPPTTPASSPPLPKTNPNFVSPADPVIPTSTPLQPVKSIPPAFLPQKSTPAPVTSPKKTTRSSVLGSTVWNPIAKSVSSITGLNTSPLNIAFAALLALTAFGLAILDVFLFHSKAIKSFTGFMRKIIRFKR